MHEASVARSEAASLVIEAFEVIVEVDMQPFTTGFAGAVTSGHDNTDSNSLTSSVGGDHDILNPGVDQAVPDHVHKTNQSITLASGYPTQAVVGDELTPFPFRLGEDPRFKCFGVELIDLLVGELATPLVSDWTIRKHVETITPTERGTSRFRLASNS